MRKSSLLNVDSVDKKHSLVKIFLCQSPWRFLWAVTFLYWHDQVCRVCSSDRMAYSNVGIRALEHMNQSILGIIIKCVQGMFFKQGQFTKNLSMGYLALSCLCSYIKKWENCSALRWNPIIKKKGKMKFNPKLVIKSVGQSILPLTRFCMQS